MSGAWRQGGSGTVQCAARLGHWQVSPLCRDTPTTEGPLCIHLNLHTIWRESGSAQAARRRAPDESSHSTPRTRTRTTKVKRENLSTTSSVKWRGCEYTKGMGWVCKSRHEEREKLENDFKGLPAVRTAQSWHSWAWGCRWCPAGRREIPCRQTSRTKSRLCRSRWGVATLK